MTSVTEPKRVSLRFPSLYDPCLLLDLLVPAHNPTSLISYTDDAELEEAQGATSKRILDMVDRISQWSLFQQATETAYIKKKMEEFSNTDLKLTIQLTSLVGRLALNIPPPPTDRLW